MRFQGYRSGGLSLINNIITKPERAITEQDDLSEEERGNLSHKQLVKVSVHIYHCFSFNFT